jgi:L-lactate utilization protein LutC
MEKQTGSKEHILAQIRTALGRSASTVAPEPLPPFARPHASKEIAELVSQFSRELEKVGGSITCVQTVEEIRKHCQRLFPADEFPSVAVSNGEVLREVGIREWLVADNRHIIPSFEEFLLARMQVAVTHSEPDTPPVENEKPSHEYSHVLLDATLGITGADYALADTGTLVLISSAEQHRLISLLPPVHVCFLDPSRIFASLTELLAHLQVAYETHGLLPQALTCITGPSRTADIEQTITMGVHGPRALHVILYRSH